LGSTCCIGSDSDCRGDDCEGQYQDDSGDDGLPAVLFAECEHCRSHCGDNPEHCNKNEGGAEHTEVRCFGQTPKQLFYDVDDGLSSWL